MKKLNLYTAVKSAILFTLVLLFTTSLFAQADANKGTGTKLPTVTTQTIDTQQAGSWSVDIDHTQTTVVILANRQIGTGHHSVSLEIRLNPAATGLVQGQVTMSGYLEDLPSAS